MRIRFCRARTVRLSRYGCPVLLTLLCALCYLLISPVFASAQQPSPGDSAAKPPSGDKPAAKEQSVGGRKEKDKKKADDKQNPGAKKTGKPAEKSQAPDPKTEPGAKPLPAVSPEARYDYQGEATGIVQQLFKFHSAYEGPNSLASRNETEVTHTYTLYLGARLVRNLEVYVNPELAEGNGFSAGAGLGGVTSGDLIGQQALTKAPYVARAFVRWRVTMPHLGPHAGGEEADQEQTGRAPNIIAGKIPAHRLVIQAGKMAVSDVFDLNAYANNPRTQFLNNAFVNNLAYDFAEDIRGYDYGISVAWIDPDWALRVGTFAMPTVAGGQNLSGDLANNRSDQIEVDRNFGLLRSPTPPMTLRLLAYRNAANMGRYRDALAAAQDTGKPPDITAVRRSAAKYG